MPKQTFVPHVIKANPAVAKIRDLLVNVMNVCLSISSLIQPDDLRGSP